MNNNLYAYQVGRRLRYIRKQKQLSLKEVEEKSNGRWKSIVVGSYERGDRAITINRLFELASFYMVPVSYIIDLNDKIVDERRKNKNTTQLNIPETQVKDKIIPLIINVKKLTSMPDGISMLLKKYVLRIQEVRGDYVTDIITLRDNDKIALSVIYNMDIPKMMEVFQQDGVLVE